MSLYLRGNIWWSRIVRHGKAFVRSTKCKNREEASTVEKILLRNQPQGKNILELNNLPYSHPAYALFEQKFLRKKYKCRYEGIEFSIPPEDFYPLPKFCPVLGIELDYEAGGRPPADNCPSFDKLEPKDGYVKGNVRVISCLANRLKSDANAQQLRQVAAYIEHSQISPRAFSCNKPCDI